MLLLASSSPTRKTLLEDFGVVFEQYPLAFEEEKISTITPKSFAYQACRLKLESVLKEIKELKQNAILVADSVIEVEGKLQRKAQTKEQAKAMLELQSGREITIITAQILKSKNLEVCDVSKTRLWLGDFKEKDLQKYLDSGLWNGKAGGVMVEGFHKKYILKQNGLLSTAMGLSVEKFLPFFEII
ncbi:septum formation inhibitor Maf [Helicobacter mustelae]|uniref:Nucleoside triphosphate pyrophosphatase n=1 Tax=Helicobacter mustelae (strain ATCC 43772 / CCUG 25715 / CIP 103759 / LMG 18044 / NCTC 12198 / R85-136P) TaxID=679897 RepID=D3UHC2_HELM1|nr:septum formation inhibitor Maf [Helicobacter mustelae]CBG39894.1 MAF homolog [Helicobacter mustelae 12198]SQH71405.1 MAF-like protein [Helicobacter mustelae]